MKEKNDLNEFFTQMGTLERILWYIAVPASLVLILQTALTIFGGGGEALEDIDDADFDSDEGTLGFHIFTVRNFIAFFTFFAWTGIVAQRSGARLLPTILYAFAAGLLAVLFTASLFVFINKMTEKGNIDYKNSIGRVGTVYLKIPAAMQGKGKIEILFQSRLSYIDAMTKDGIDIPTGEKVNVASVDNNILIVTSIKGE